MKKYLTLLINLGFLISCNFNHTPHMQQLSSWDELLESQPLSVKDSLNTLNLRALNTEEKAYFYLLQAAAADKNSELIRNDSALSAAARYYQENEEYLKLARTQLYLAEYQYLEKKNAEESYNLLKQAEINYNKSNREDLKILGLIYYWLGQIQHTQCNLLEAESYYNKSIKLYYELNDSLSTAYSLRQLGRVFTNKKEFKKAKESLSQATEIVKNLDHGNDPTVNQLYIGILNNQSFLYQNMGNNDSALLFNKECLSFINTRNYPTKSPYYQVTLRLYRQTNNLDSSKYYCQQMLAAAEKEDNLFSLAYGYKSLFQIEEAQGNYQKSCELRDRFNQLKDKLNSQNEKEALKELETKYNLAEKEKENLKTKNRSLWIITLSFIIAFAASIITLYYMWTHRKLKVRNNRLAEEIKKTQWGFALSKELINDNSAIYEELERLLSRNISSIPSKIYDEFQESFRKQKSNYSQRLFFALTNIDNTFIEKLRKKCPDLSPEDIMLASMIRHQWNVSDIAQIFRITFDALKKRKYRLRMKILGNENSKISLENFLIHL